MCGISGFTWADRTLVERMNEVNGFRGPDDSGTFIDDRVSLGHTRLAIIDLSPRGHQPMVSPDGGLRITYNGEIYNFQELREELIQRGHRFTSTSDTEVILHAWEEYGAACLNRFNGMWAFCLYDGRRLILARDRFGVKPLYYYEDQEKLIFSSMIRAILLHGIETSPDDRVIMEYLAFNLEDHTPATFFRNIRALPPGHYLEYDLTSRRSTLNRWYFPRARGAGDAGGVRDLFLRSVRRRTVADVPIGSCLSGGIDSSAIVATLDTILEVPFSTFSLVIPGHPSDESTYIREVGRHTKTRQHFTTVDVETFLSDFRDFICAQEEPVIGLSPYGQYRVMRLAHENGAKVLLDGQGGDEVYAGYPYYSTFHFIDLLRKGRLLTLVRGIFTTCRTGHDLLTPAMFLFLLLPRRLQYFIWKRGINAWVNHRFLEECFDTPRDPRWNRMSFREALSLTFRATTIPHLLRWEDKNSMRWSVETRLPFLDVDIVEASLDLPAELLIEHGMTKVIFRKAMKDLIPEKILARTDKIGFDTPMSEFFRDERLVTFCRGILSSEPFRNRPYWKWDEVERLFEAHVDGKTDASLVIWKVINLELWLRMFFPPGGTSGQTEPAREPS